MPLSQFREFLCPYHFSIRTRDQSHFVGSLDELWLEFGKVFSEAYFLFGVRIHCFVMMGNHIHILFTPDPELLNSTPQTQSSGNTHKMESADSIIALPFVSYLKIQMTDKLDLQTDYFLERIRSRIHYKLVYKYIYRNPVAAKIVSRAERYPYSSLAGLLGRKVLPFPVFDNLGLITNSVQVLSWLNSPMPFYWQHELDPTTAEMPPEQFRSDELF